MRSRTPYLLLACLVALLVIGMGGLTALLPQSGTPLPSAIGGPFTLTAHDGRIVSDQTYHGQWLLIFFGYTSCPDACPTALNNTGVALDRLSAEAAALQPVFITVDPKRDTRERLADYLKSFDPRIVGLTGTEEQIAAAVRAYHVYVVAHEGSDDNYLVDHSSYFYLIDPAGRFVNVLPGDLSGEEIEGRLRRLMKSGV